MRPKLALKNIWRSWVKSLFIFILLAASTCLLFSNVMEFVVNRRETERAIELFDGVGTMNEPLTSGGLSSMAMDQTSGDYILTDPRVPIEYYPDVYKFAFRNTVSYSRLKPEDVEKIENLPYVTYTDKRYMTAGVSPEFYRVDPAKGIMYDFTNCFVIEATVEQWYEIQGLHVTDIEFIAGKELMSFEYNDIFIVPQPERPVYVLDDGTEFSPEVWRNGPAVVTENKRYGRDVVKELEQGERYVFVVRSDGYDMTGETLPSFFLTDHFTYDWCDAIWSLDGEPENYLETEKFAPLRQYITVMETDLYTFDMVYTQNMGAIRYFADGTLGISDGRRLNRDDYLNGNNVCVVNHEVARVYGLEVGDTITLDLGNKLFEQYEGVGAIAAVPERLSTEYTEVTLEIVGIWKDRRNTKLKISEPDPCWSYNLNTIFVPTHLLSVDEAELENHTFAMGEFSFVIENVYDVEIFKETGAKTIREMRYPLTLNDGNWKDIEKTFEDSKDMALIKIAVLSVTVVVATLFTVFLYILGRKRDYAVMRVLGTTKRKSRNTILLPLMVITSAAVLVGTAVAWIYTVNSSKLDMVISQAEEYSADKSVPPWLIISCILAVMLLAVCAASVILNHIGRKSPLELLQDRSQKRTKKRKTKTLAAELEHVELGEWKSLPKPHSDGKKRRMSFIWRFVFRSIRRTKAKSVMFIIVSALLLNAAGQLNVLLDSYGDVYEETEVVSSYAGSLNLHYVSQLQESGYVKDVFYRSATTLDINHIPVPAYFTNNINRIREGYVNYLDGYDDSVMQGHDKIIVLSSQLMLAYGFNLGDTVYIMKGGDYSSWLSKLVRWHRSETLDSELAEEDLERLTKEADEWYMKNADAFKVVGYINTDKYMVFLPGTLEMSTIHGKLVIMELTEATLIDNWKVDEYREYGIELAAANKTDEVAFLMDTTKIDHIRGIINLLEIIAPVAIIAMLVIGVFMTSLIIVQTSKDVAIMRVLGTSKARTRVIIVAERMILCIIGMVLAAAVMFAMRGVNAVVLQKTAMVLALYFAAVLLSSCVASVAVSRKNVLELLQTKE